MGDAGHHFFIVRNSIFRGRKRPSKKYWDIGFETEGEEWIYDCGGEGECVAFLEAMIESAKRCIERIKKIK